MSQSSNSTNDEALSSEVKQLEVTSVRRSSDINLPIHIVQKVKPERIVILGAGSFGTAIGGMFARNGHTVVILDRKEERCKIINETHKNPSYMKDFVLPDTLSCTTDPKAAFEGATYCFHAIPIQASQSYLETIKPYLKKEVPIISMSKGIHCESLKFMNEIVEDVFGKDQLCAFLSGPSFAKEILSNQPTGLVIASSDIETAKRIASTLQSDPRVRVWVLDDVVGVEVGGALKNIYAIGAGIVEGAGFGYNPTAMVVTRGCSEMKKMAVALGAKQSTLAGLSGIGDLMLTCFGPASRNRSVGVRIGKGETLDQIIASMNEVAEGVPTILAGRKLAAKLNLQLPLLEAVYGMVYKGMKVEAVLDRLMNMPTQEED